MPLVNLECATATSGTDTRSKIIGSDDVSAMNRRMDESYARIRHCVQSLQAQSN